MGMSMGDYLVVYDIADPRRLRRVAKKVEKFGVRVQKSVFECVLSLSRRSELEKESKKLMDEHEDSMRIYPLLAKSREK
jgi:CRISPR-associated protein Cas2